LSQLVKDNKEDMKIVNLIVDRVWNLVKINNSTSWKGKSVGIIIEGRKDSIAPPWSKKFEYLP